MPSLHSQVGYRIRNAISHECHRCRQQLATNFMQATWDIQISRQDYFPVGSQEDYCIRYNHRTCKPQILLGRPPILQSIRVECARHHYDHTVKACAVCRLAVKVKANRCITQLVHGKFHHKKRQWPMYTAGSSVRVANAEKLRSPGPLKPTRHRSGVTPKMAFAEAGLCRPSHQDEHQVSGERPWHPKSFHRSKSTQ